MDSARARLVIYFFFSALCWRDSFQETASTNKWVANLNPIDLISGKLLNGIGDLTQTLSQTENDFLEGPFKAAKRQSDVSSYARSLAKEYKLNKPQTLILANSLAATASAMKTGLNGMEYGRAVRESYIDKINHSNETLKLVGDLMQTTLEQIFPKENDTRADNADQKNLLDITKSMALASSMLGALDFSDILKSNFNGEQSPQSYAKEIVKNFGLDSNVTDSLVKLFTNTAETISEAPTVSDYAENILQAWNRTAKSIGIEKSSVDADIIGKMVTDAVLSVADYMPIFLSDPRIVNATSVAKLTSTMSEASQQVQKILTSPLSLAAGYALAETYAEKTADRFHLSDQQKEILESALTGTIPAMGSGAGMLQYINTFGDTFKEIKKTYLDNPRSGDASTSAMKAADKVMHIFKNTMEKIGNIPENDMLSHFN